MNGLTNLLPRDRAHALSRDYLYRLAAVAAALALLLIAIHAALLLPSYLYLSEETKTRAAHLEGISGSLDGTGGQDAAGHAAALSATRAAILALISGPSASEAVRSVLAVPQRGVLVTGIALTLPEAGEGEMRLTGTAPTRDSLQQYHAALSALSYVSKADLPLSVYAEEHDLPFTITLRGTFRP